MQDDPPAENQITEVKTDSQPTKGSTYMDMDEETPEGEGEGEEENKEKNEDNVTEQTHHIIG